MRGVGFLSPASGVRIVKRAKRFFSSTNQQRPITVLFRPSERTPLDKHCQSVDDGLPVGRRPFHGSCTKCASACSGNDRLKYFSGVMSNASPRSVADMQCRIHASSVLVSDSLGADSTGRTSAESAKQQFEKWKANIDFDLLTEAHRRIHNAHMKAIEENRETYTDPVSDFEVFTIMTHLLRGNCCGNVCRHCPYGHVNAPKEYKELMRYNTAFYY